MAPTGRSAILVALIAALMSATGWYGLWTRRREYAAAILGHPPSLEARPQAEVAADDLAAAVDGAAGGVPPWADPDLGQEPEELPPGATLLGVPQSTRESARSEAKQTRRTRWEAWPRFTPSQKDVSLRDQSRKQRPAWTRRPRRGDWGRREQGRRRQVRSHRWEPRFM